ncbi:hypothetical protein [Phaeodactylibacter xiamenensis]|uniref:hypothetical protein n=1 Tax=Phaeodactylibacter xiamenensis TaxID=1524460 RepID=UPI0024A7E138|nr:hypothetical protein [Phaeodactylibacter xiamenensis]
MDKRNQQVLFIGLGALVAYALFRRSGGGGGGSTPGAGLYMDCAIPRGIRNNNPGNLKVSNSAWLGKVPFAENTDIDCQGGQVVRTFEQFYEYRYGIRALIKLIQNYMEGRNLRTIAQIINRYAPSSENNSTAYIDYVSDRLGIAPNVPLQFTRETMRLLVQAIARHENGREAITDAEFYDVWGEWWGGIAGTPSLEPNTPAPSTRANKKRMVLASRGGRQEIIHYGDPDYRHNYSAEARRNYCARSAFIRDGAGRLTKDNIFSANYWSRRDLWNC